jgi:hypothetical protein
MGLSNEMNNQGISFFYWDFQLDYQILGIVIFYHRNFGCVHPYNLSIDWMANGLRSAGARAAWP